MNKRMSIFMEGVAKLGLTDRQVGAIGRITKVCLEGASVGKTGPYYVSYLIQDDDSIRNIDRMVDNDDIQGVIADYGILLDPTDESSVSDTVPFIEKGTDFTVGTADGVTLVHNSHMFGAYMLYRELNPSEQAKFVKADDMGVMEGVGCGNEYNGSGSTEDGKLDAMYAKLLDLGVSADSIDLVLNINGSNEDTMRDILYATTGYRDFDQVEDEPTF